jgi:4'-phosphopantetheinyl transferase
MLLSRYLGSEPHFLYGGGGKPELAATSGGSSFRFNASHSQGLALYAVTRERRVGIDVEALRPLPEAEAIAQLYFSSGENAVLRALPPERRQEAFFLGWTRKEAYLKAVGSGLVQPLECIEVSLAPGEPAILHSIDGDPEVAARWSLQTLSVDFGYVAALAVEGNGYRLACLEAPTP